MYLTTVKTTKDRCLKQLPVQAKTNSLLIVAVLQPSTCVFLCTSIFVPHLWLVVRFFPGIPSNKLENIIQTIWLQIHPKIWKALKNWSQNCKVIPKPVGGIFVSPAFKKNNTTVPPLNWHSIRRVARADCVEAASCRHRRATWECHMVENHIGKRPRKNNNCTTYG